MPGESTNRISTALIWCATLLNTTNYTIVIPTADHYISKQLGAPDAIAGLMVGMFPLAKAVFNTPSNMWIKAYSIGSYFIITCVTQLLGNIIYACAQVSQSYPMALVGRVILGALGGQLLNGSFVARGFDANQRSPVMLLMQNAQVSAYVLGPLVGGLLNLVCAEAGWSSSLWNENTTPAWLMALCSLVLMLLCIFFFTEPPPDNSGSGGGTNTSGVAAASETTMPWARLMVAYTVVFMVPTLIGSWELHTVAYATNQWNWKIVDAGLYLAACMVFAFPATLYGSKFAKRYSDRFAIFLTTGALLPFTILIIPPIVGPSDQTTREIIVYSIGSIGFVMFLQVAAGLTKSLCTKMTPVPLRQKAVGIMALFSAFGRTAGPIIASCIKVEWEAWEYVFLALALSQFLLVMSPWGYNALVPHIAVVTSAPPVDQPLADPPVGERVSFTVKSFGSIRSQEARRPQSWHPGTAPLTENSMEARSEDVTARSSWHPGTARRPASFEAESG